MNIFKKSLSVLLSIIMLMSIFTTAISVSAAENKVYFVNTRGWGQVNVYNWYNDGGENAGWPGEQAPLTSIEDGYGIYSYDVKDFDGVIFNNGGSIQTENLVASDLIGKYYEPKTNRAYDTPAEAIKGFNEMQTYDYYVVGSAGLCGSEWLVADPTCGMDASPDGTYSKTFENIAAGTYEFKINTGKWASEGGEEYPPYNYVLTVDYDDSTVHIMLTADKAIKTSVVSPNQPTAPTQASTISKSYLDYSLVGYINGANVGQGENISATPNIFNFMGQVTLAITQTSYVCVKTINNFNWYQTAGYLGDNVTTATLYNANSMPGGASPDKLMVPPGTATFKLVINDNGTLTLSYTLIPRETMPTSAPTIPTYTQNTTAKPTTSPTSQGYVFYYPACPAGTSSFYNGLVAIGVDASMSYRTKIAQANGISNYTGTAEQNEALLQLLLRGKLINPENVPFSTTAPIQDPRYFPACASTHTSFTTALASVGAENSKTYRVAIAKMNGISGYTGTAEQNNSLLALLKQGKLLKPTSDVLATATEWTSGTNPTTAPQVSYFPACADSYTTFYSAMISIGFSEVSTNWDIHCRIAEANGITDFTGTAEQNTKLLNLLKKGLLINPGYDIVSTDPTEPSTPDDPIVNAGCYPACDSSYNTLVSGLASIGVDTSMSYRAKIALANGVSDYTGTVDQNTYLLNLLKQGKLVNPDYNSEVSENTVYILNNVGWDNVYVYVWGGTEKEEVEFPGELAQLVDEENNIYAFDIGDARAVIYSDGATQKTIRMSAESLRCKYYNLALDLIYDTKEDAIDGRGSSLIPVEPPEYEFTVTGDIELCGSAWDPKDANNLMEYNEKTERYEKLFTGVSAGVYEFIVTTNGEIGFYDMNLEGLLLDPYDYVILEVEDNYSTVLISCDASKVYVSINGEEHNPGGDTPAQSHLLYTTLNDGTVQITGFMGNVENLVIPSEVNGVPVTSILNNAFYCCQSFRSITLPKTIKEVGMDAFKGCTNLEAVHISDMTAWCNIEFGNIYANPLYYARNLYLNNELVTELKVPEGVTEIGLGAFYGCYSLTNVILPESVEFISLMAFWNCINLNSLVVKNSKCEFYDDPSTIPRSTMLYGYNGSTTHAFASNHGFTFVNLSSISKHIWGKENRVDSDCTQDGKSTKMCIICGEVETKIIEASGHNWSEYTVTKKATYFEKGSKTASCMLCGEKKTVSISMLKLGKPKVTITGGKKKLVVKYKKVKGATGFQIKYKANKKTNKKTYAATKNTKKVINNLKKGTYKVQVRALVMAGVHLP